MGLYAPDCEAAWSSIYVMLCRRRWLEPAPFGAWEGRVDGLGSLGIGHGGGYAQARGAAVASFQDYYYYYYVTDTA